MDWKVKFYRTFSSPRILIWIHLPTVKVYYYAAVKAFYCILSKLQIAITTIINWAPLFLSLELFPLSKWISNNLLLCKKFFEYWYFFTKLAIFIDLMQWFSMLEPRRPTKDEYENFGGPLYTFWNFFDLFYTFNWAKMNLFGCFSMHLLLIIVKLLILSKIRKVLWPTKKSLRPSGWETLIYIIACKKFYLVLMVMQRS